MFTLLADTCFSSLNTGRIVMMTVAVVTAGGVLLGSALLFTQSRTGEN